MSKQETFTISPEFEITMPTPEELRERSLNWLEVIQPTLIDQWPQDLHDLSVPTKYVTFPTELVDDLFDGSKNPPSKGIRNLANEIDDALGWRRRFVRLNSRSPKDSPWPFETPITLSGKEAISILGCSERILTDLCNFQHVPEQPALICLRNQIYTINNRTEYRCFVRDGELIAVSYYHYNIPLEAPQSGGKELREKIDRWFVKKLKPALHIDTVVFDLHIHGTEMVLIEINPYGLSDPCQFVTYKNVESSNSYIQFDRLATPTHYRR